MGCPAELRQALSPLWGCPSAQPKSILPSSSSSQSPATWWPQHPRLVSETHLRAGHFQSMVCCLQSARPGVQAQCPEMSSPFAHLLKAAKREGALVPSGVPRLLRSHVWAITSAWRSCCSGVSVSPVLTGPHGGHPHWDHAVRPLCCPVSPPATRRPGAHQPAYMWGGSGGPSGGHP